VSSLKIKIPNQICVKNQQIHQLFIQFINYVGYLLHVSALNRHHQAAKTLGTLPDDGNVMPKHVGATIHK
jgi:hypothetical protein